MHDPGKISAFFLQEKQETVPAGRSLIRQSPQGLVKVDLTIKSWHVYFLT